MKPKKPYVIPQVYKVPLQPEQAILSTCSLMTMNGLVGFGNNTCRAVGFACKQGDMAFGAGDSGPRPS